MELGLVKPMFPCSKKKTKDPITNMLANYFRTGADDASLDNLNDPARIIPLTEWQNCHSFVSVWYIFPRKW